MRLGYHCSLALGHGYYVVHRLILWRSSRKTIGGEVIGNKKVFYVLRKRLRKRLLPVVH